MFIYRTIVFKFFNRRLRHRAQDWGFDGRNSPESKHCALSVPVAIQTILSLIDKTKHFYEIVETMTGSSSAGHNVASFGSLSDQSPIPRWLRSPFASRQILRAHHESLYIDKTFLYYIRGVRTCGPYRWPRIAWFCFSYNKKLHCHELFSNIHRIAWTYAPLGWPVEWHSTITIGGILRSFCWTSFPYKPFDILQPCNLRNIDPLLANLIKFWSGPDHSVISSTYSMTNKPRSDDVVYAQSYLALCSD